MDIRLGGFWSVRTIDMVPNRAVRLIGGLVGELVEFTADGHYILWGDPADPDRGEKLFRWHDSDPPGLDIWIPGLEPLANQCLCRIAEDEMQICVSGDSRPRPTEIRRDDRKLWCVYSFVRWGRPAPIERRRRKKVLHPGRPISP